MTKAKRPQGLALTLPGPVDEVEQSRARRLLVSGTSASKTLLNGGPDHHPTRLTPLTVSYLIGPVFEVSKVANTNSSTTCMTNASSHVALANITTLKPGKSSIRVPAALWDDP